MSIFNVQGPVILADAPSVLASARARCTEMISHGIMRDRALPDGDDSAVWIGDAQRPIAVATFHEVQREGRLRRWWIDIVHVDADRRREGLGRALVATIINEAERDGVSIIVMGVTHADEAMARLSGECQFEPAYTVVRREVA